MPSGSDFVMFCDLAEDAVPALPRLVDITSLQ
jgi:hypothetical protein